MKYIQHSCSVVTLISIFLLSACSENNHYVENEHYTVFENTLDDVIEAQSELSEAPVYEFFTYGCSHCQTFAPVLANWAKKQNENVVYIPVVWSETTELHAKAFFLIQKKAEFKTLHAGLFKLTAGFSRTDSIEEQKIALIDWFQQQGIQPIESLKAIDTSEYEQQLAQSLLLTKRFKVSGTPTLVVNQKYRINNKAVNSQKELLEIAKQLLKD